MKKSIPNHKRKSNANYIKRYNYHVSETPQQTLDFFTQRGKEKDLRESQQSQLTFNDTDSTMAATTVCGIKSQSSLSDFSDTRSMASQSASLFSSNSAASFLKFANDSGGKKASGGSLIDSDVKNFSIESLLRLWLS